MAPKPYGGGYNEVTAGKLASVSVPKHIRCGTCSKWRPGEQYSNRQLSDLRHGILIHGQGVGLSKSKIKCRGCTGMQRSELTCVMCDAVKSLDLFALKQRKTPDDSRCIRCMEKLLNGDNDLTAEEEEQDDDDESDISNCWEQTSADNGTMSYAGSEYGDSSGSDGGVALPGSSIHSALERFSTLSMSNGFESSSESVATFGGIGLSDHVDLGPSSRTSYAASVCSDVRSMASDAGDDDEDENWPGSVSSRSGFIKSNGSAGAGKENAHAYTIDKDPDDDDEETDDDIDAEAGGVSLNGPWSSMKSAKHDLGNGVSFNSWDTRGTRHTDFRSPSTVGSVISRPSTSAYASSTAYPVPCTSKFPKPSKAPVKLEKANRPTLNYMLNDMPTDASDDEIEM